MSQDQKRRDLRNSARELAAYADAADPAHFGFLQTLYALKEKVDRDFGELAADSHTPAQATYAPILPEPEEDEGKSG